MFTGIIQAVGQIEDIQSGTGDIAIKINVGSLNISDIKEGDSIAVNGVCLTATHIDKTHFQADVSKETLNITTGLDKITSINLETALRFNDYLGGHLVSGHVDGVGTVQQFSPVNNCWQLTIEAPHAISKYIARKGSICVNGVSLTVNTIEKDTFSVNIIPHTIEKTTLGSLKPGSHVNLEIDQIARYVERMQAWESENQ